MRLLLRLTALTVALLAALTSPVSLADAAGTTEPVVRQSASARGFKHPGVLLSRTQLDRLRKRVKAGGEWRSSFAAMRHSRYGSLGYHATPVRIVECPPDDRPGYGCVEERQDAIAAYTQALLWYVTRDRAHARKAVQIMDAWSAVLRDHTDGNAGLQAAWAGSSWARAAEIMRHTYGGWPRHRVRRFAGMLRTVYLREVTVTAPDYNGNWDLAMTDAAMGISVFLDDRRGFNRAVRRFRARVPAYFYLKSDGPLPKRPPGGHIRTPDRIREYWFGQRRFVNGLGQETCRNFTHIGYSLAATAHIAETAWHQGLDLYGEVGTRMRAALTLHARYQLGADVPHWLCGGNLDLDMGPDTEVALNHFRNRKGISMPQAQRVAQRLRDEGTDDLFVAWEALTHAKNR
ncbi:alginate lyase family protein [Streptomyces sp. QH1-20]|uniref:alginate lyase family protein n=1 Tax=Streptomyces sp. QH1-20 TaxID=3240934 RepID=UPI003513CC06